MTEKLPYDEDIVGAEEYIPEEVAKYMRRAEVEREPKRAGRRLRLLGATAIGLTSMAAGVAFSRYRATHA